MFRVDVTDDNVRWSSNMRTFETEREATDYGYDLCSRWLATRGFRVVPADHPQHEVVDYEADAAAGRPHRNYAG